jgi:hypothetical protein
MARCGCSRATARSLAASDIDYDLICLDGDHSYDAIRRDAEPAILRPGPGGVIVFNDYILHDHLTDGSYGVIPAVNDLLAGGGWRMTGFAFHGHMFCDVMIERA